MQLNKIVQVQSIAGTPVSWSGLIITPQAQSIRIHGPRGQFAWVRPTSVLVERDSSQERIPIVDVTIIAVLAIAGISILYSLGSRLRQIRRNENG